MTGDGIGRRGRSVPVSLVDRAPTANGCRGCAVAVGNTELQCLDGFRHPPRCHAWPIGRPSAEFRQLTPAAVRGRWEDMAIWRCVGRYGHSAATLLNTKCQRRYRATPL